MPARVRGDGALIREALHVSRATEKISVRLQIEMINAIHEAVAAYRGSQATSRRLQRAMKRLQDMVP